MSSSSPRSNRSRKNARNQLKSSRLRRFLFESLENRMLLAVDIDWSKSLSLEQLQSGKVDLSSSPMFSYDYSGQAQKMVVLADRLALDLTPQTEADLSRLTPYGLTLSRPLDNSFSIYTTTQPVTDELIAALQTNGVVEKSVPVFGMVATKSEAALLNEVIVSLPEGQTADQYFADPRFSGYRRLDGTPDQFIGSIKDAYGADALEIIQQLGKSNQVTWVAPNFYQAWQKFYTPNDPRFTNQWHLHNTGQGGGLADTDSNLPEAWDVLRGGSPTVVVGVVDDGVPTNHPDILNWVNAGEIAGDGLDNDGNGWIDDINGWNFVTNNNVSIPDTVNDMHGTSVGGVAAAVGDNGQGVAGAAYRSTVLSARIFRNNGVASDAGIASAVYYASGRRANGVGTFSASTIANHSWGGGATSAAITAAFQWASTQGRGGLGVPQVVATGNGFGAVSYPANLSSTEPGVIAVGAINNQGTKSDYSNFGPQVDIVTGSNDTRVGYLAIDTTDRIGADGYNNADDYTGTGATGFGGTSSATPLAAGIGALALARAEQLGVQVTAAELKKMFRNNTKLAGPDPYAFPANRNDRLGWGLLNAATLVNGIGKAQISITTETGVVGSNSTRDIGQSVVGGTYTIKFRIRNQGTAPLNLGSTTVTGTDFSVYEAPSLPTLQVGESTIFSIRLKPTSAGAKLGTVRLSSNDAALPLMQFFVSSTAVDANVSGYFYEDYNGDTQFTNGEPGLPNQRVILDANNNGVVDYTNFVNNTATAINDLQTVTSNLNVTGFSGVVKDLNVTINATHTWVSDLVIELVSPSGARATLINSRGGSGDNLTNTVFDDDASTSIASGAAPFTGSFIPESSMKVFNEVSPNGLWRLVITDQVGGDFGTLLNWTISVTNEFTTTNDAGFYFFRNIANGTYNDIGVTPAGYNASGPSQYPITITSPTTSILDRNFGVSKNFTAYAYAFLDYDRNGTRTLDEPGLPRRTFNVAAVGTLNTVQTFNTLTPLLDPGTRDFPLVIPQGKGFVQDVNVSLNLTHTWNSDLNISLISPTGTIIDLSSGNGGASDNYTNTVFDDSAATSITAGAAPFTGTFRPEQPLSTFNGTSASGTWILRVTDTFATDTGNLISWGLTMVSGLNNVSLLTDPEGWVKVDVIPATTSITLVNVPDWFYTNPVSGIRTIVPTGTPVFDQIFGTRPINLPPTVDPIFDQFVLEDSGPLSIDISGLTAGRGDPEQFRLSLTNTASPALTTPVLNYTSPDSTGTITLSTIPDQSGQSILTLVVEDAGADNDFSTTADNATTNVVFTVTVIPVNDAPLIDSVGNLTVNEDAPTQTVNLTGILAGGGESQTLQITAVSNNTALIPNPAVNYTSPDNSGSLSFLPVANMSGQAEIVVTLMDAGIDGLFGTGDELSVTTTFTITVNPVNDAPTLAALPNVIVDEDSGPRTVNLSGITAGPLESQPLRVSARSSETWLIANPSVTYTSPSTTGSLVFTPITNKFGSTIISVLVEDGGLDNDLSTAADNASFTRTFTITVNPVADPPSFDPIADISFDEDATNQVINVTGINAGGEEVQPLRLIAKSSRPGQVTDLTVNYNSPDSTGTIVLNGLKDEFGTFFITVLVEDGGVDNNLSTPADNQYVQRTFNVTVRPINDPPIVTVPTTIIINEDDPQQTINLTGILGGPGETEPVLASLTTGDNTLLLNQTLSYTTPSTTGQITFTPAANKFGTTILTLRLEDAGPDFRFNTTADNQVLVLPITVTVLPVNDPPSFAAISNLTINEDNPGQLVSITGITAGLDEVQPMRITATSSNVFVLPDPAVSYTSPNATGSLLLVPVANQSGTSVITVTLEDGGVDANLATLADNTSIIRSFTVTVAAVNDAPTLNPISNASTTEDSTPQAVVLTGISAGGNEIQPLRVSAVSSNPSLVSNPSVNYGSPSNTGVLVYAPNPNQFGSAVITVTVEDGGLDQNLLTAADNGSSTQTFTVTVSPVNDAPTISPIGNLSINEDSGNQSVSLAGITAGPSESQVLRVTATSSNPALLAPTVNYVSPASNGSISFSPTAEQSGSATITVTVEDGGLDNDLLTTADNGTVIQSFTVTVVAVNDAPSLNPISSVAIDEDSEVVVDLQGIFAGGGESQNLRVLATSSNSALLATLAVTYVSPESFGSIRVVPNGNLSGQTVITVVVEDAGLDGNFLTAFDNGTATRSFTVTVNPVNDLPTIGSVANQSVNEDSLLNVAVSGITAGGGEAQALRVSAVSDNPGLLTPDVTYTSPQSSASIRLQPAANEFGTAIVVLTVEDGGADNNLSTTFDNGSVNSTFTVTVVPTNDKPLIDAIGNQAIDEDGQITIGLSGISAGPGESQSLRVTATSSRLGVIATPVVTYTSPQSVASLQLQTIPNSNGSSIISIQVEDGGDDNDLSTTSDNLIAVTSLTVTVNSVNDLPTIDAVQNISINEDSNTSVTIGGINAGPNEVQPLRVTAVVVNSSVIQTPIVTYASPGASATIDLSTVKDMNGTVVVTYMVEDGGEDGNLNTASDNLSVTKSFTVTVLPVNDAPSIGSVANHLIEWNSLGTLVNLTGISGGPNEVDQLRIVATSSHSSILPNPQVQYVSPSASAVLNLVPAAGAFGDVVIDVVVEDGGADGDLSTTSDNLKSTTSFQVTVNAVPVSTPERIRTTRNQNATVNVLTNDQDADGGVAELTAVITTAVPASDGTVQVLPNGSIRYIPAPGFFGITSFTYVARDKHGSESDDTQVVIGVGKSALQNPFMNVDTNRSGTLTPSDALAVIDILNNASLSKLVGDLLTQPYDVDVNGDGRVTPTDAVIVIDALTANLASEGEAGEALVPQSSVTSPVDAFFADYNEIEQFGKRIRRS